MVESTSCSVSGTEDYILFVLGAKTVSIVKMQFSLESGDIFGPPRSYGRYRGAEAPQTPSSSVLYSRNSL